MSDPDLRALERRWRETGSPEDETAWLRERVRVGDLGARRVELASYLGHSAAGRVALVEAPTDCTTWLTGLEGWADDPRSRAALAIARAVLPRFEAQGIDAEIGLRPLLAIHALEQWVTCPCEGCYLRVGRASGLARAAAPRVGRASIASPSQAAAWVAVYAALCTGEGEGGSTSHYLPVVARLALEVESSIYVREVVRAELAPWALGYGDPVRERVEARLRVEAAGE